eukprot:13932-Heterococcus_DN1.PRE.2
MATWCAREGEREREKERETGSFERDEALLISALLSGGGGGIFRVLFDLICSSAVLAQAHSALCSLSSMHSVCAVPASLSLSAVAVVYAQVLFFSMYTE